MITAQNIRSREVALTCPRKAYITGNIPGGIAKYRHLSKMFMNIMDAIPLTAARQEIVNQIQTEFTMVNHGLLPFEEREEKNLMYKIIMRYLEWERHQVKSKIIAKNFKEVVPFCCDSTEVRVHRLFDRGDYYEAVLYAYKKPTLKRNSRKFQMQARNSLQLMLAYRAGEKKLERLRQMYGKDAYPEKPVYSSVFFMRDDNDNKSFDAFNERSSMVFSYKFGPSEIAAIETAYGKALPDLNKEACNPSDCYNCPCADLCKTEFLPREQIRLSEPEIKPINEIKLTKAQSEFVNFTEGECRVNAVAGSGKTTIIVLRTLNLLELGVEPEEILMITFTDLAAKEMKERIARYASGSVLKELNLDIDKLTIETFNSWGQMILSANYDRLGFTSAPVVIDDIQKKDILISILERHNKLPLNYKEPFLSTPKAMGAVIEIGRLIDTMKSAHVETAQDILNMQKLDSKFRTKANELLDVYQEYNRALLDANLIDFEDQLRLILKLQSFGIFQSLPYKHIVVDEFQDSNGNQIDLIRQIMAANPGIESLAVVGDEMQAIYGFRDASPLNLIEFKQYFPNLKDFFLEENFRSDAPIITLANNILVREARIKKAIKAQRSGSNIAPVLIIKDDPKDEAAFVVDAVKKWIEDDKIDPSSIALLGHTRSELAAYEKALSAAGIPSIMKIPEILKDCAYVKAILALAKWLNDPSQVLSFALYAKMLKQDPFNLPELKKSAETMRKIFDGAESGSERVSFFYDFLSEAKKDYLGDYFLNELKNRDSLRTFDDLIDYCVKYDKYGIQQTHSTAKEDSDAVTLITIHSAKGLEFDNVLLSLKRFKATDEEKRLLYVAVTRAKERLIVTYPQNSALVHLLED